jgi:hypothetical protein
MWLGFGAMSRVGRLERRRSMEAVVEAPRVIAADDWLVIMQVNAGNEPITGLITLYAGVAPLVPSPFFYKCGCGCFVSFLDLHQQEPQEFAMPTAIVTLRSMNDLDRILLFSPAHSPVGGLERARRHHRP